MAKYRKVESKIWNDEKFQTLPPLDKLVAMYCLTGQCNRIGIFKFSIALASEDIGLPSDEVRERLDRVCDTLNWNHDKAMRVLYLPKWWKYNNPGSSKTMQGILNDLHDLPLSPYISEFCSNFKYLSDSLCDTLRDFLAKGMPYQEQEQEQEQEHPPKPPKASKAEPKSATDDWAAAEKILLDLEIVTAPDLAKLVQANGCTRSDLDGVVNFWRSRRPTWSEGALAMRLKALRPGQDPAKLWPERPAERPGERPAAEKAEAREASLANHEAMQAKNAEAQKAASLEKLRRDFLEDQHGTDLDAMTVEEQQQLVIEGMPDMVSAYIPKLAKERKATGLLRFDLLELIDQIKTKTRKMETGVNA